METLDNKVLIMIVGPSAIGKSTLMNETVAQHDEFSYVRSFTTRAQRPGETSHYEFIGRQEALELRQTGEAITYFEHPTTGDIYGTTPRSFPTRYNLLDTLSSTVASYRDLPFQRTVTVSLTASPEEWQEWFLSRYPVPSAEATKRLREAALSIEWSLHDKETYWLENRKGDAAKTATRLAHIAISQPPKKTPDEPQMMLQLIKTGVWS